MSSLLCGFMEQMEEVLEVLRQMKKRYGDALPLRIIFKALIEKKICESSKSVSECLKKLQVIGKIKPKNTGVDIELLEDVKVDYIQSSLVSLAKR